MSPSCWAEARGGVAHRLGCCVLTPASVDTRACIHPCGGSWAPEASSALWSSAEAQWLGRWQGAHTGLRLPTVVSMGSADHQFHLAEILSRNYGVQEEHEGAARGPEKPEEELEKDFVSQVPGGRGVQGASPLLRPPSP